jgi:hypothetical protein
MLCVCMIAYVWVCCMHSLQCPGVQVGVRHRSLEDNDCRQAGWSARHDPWHYSRSQHSANKNAFFEPFVYSD